MSRTRHARRVGRSTLAYKRWRRRNVTPFSSAPRNVRREEAEDHDDPPARFVPMGMDGRERARSRANARSQRACRYTMTIEVVFDPDGRARMVLS